MNAGELEIPPQVNGEKNLSEIALWHMRVGHTPMRRMCQIDGLKGFDKLCSETCIMCPLAKFTKVPFPSSVSRPQS